jgi:hypothetical protein
VKSTVTLYINDGGILFVNEGDISISVAVSLGLGLSKTLTFPCVLKSTLRPHMIEFDLSKNAFIESESILFRKHEKKCHYHHSYMNNKTHSSTSLSKSECNCPFFFLPNEECPVLKYPQSNLINLPHTNQHNHSGFPFYQVKSFDFWLVLTVLINVGFGFKKEKVTWIGMPRLGLTSNQNESQSSYTLLQSSSSSNISLESISSASLNELLHPICTPADPLMRPSPGSIYPF